MRADVPGTAHVCFVPIHRVERPRLLLLPWLTAAVPEDYWAWDPAVLIVPRPMPKLKLPEDTAMDLSSHPVAATFCPGHLVWWLWIK